MLRREIMETKKLFLFDIDGTLFDNQNQKVSQKSLEAIRVLSKNHIVAIATGRAPFMLDSIHEIKPLIDYYITINGQYIVAGRNVIYKEPMDKHLLARLTKDFQLLQLAYGFESSHHEAVSEINDLVIQGFEGLGLSIPPIQPHFYKTHDIFQAWAFSTPEKIVKLKQKYPELVFICWMDVGYDILPNQASKGLGMKRLAQYLQIPLKDVIAFGDGDNDFEMVRDAGLGIAMGNATNEVKSVAKFITKDVSEDGIDYALRHFGYIK